jgi:hypothetical protein
MHSLQPKITTALPDLNRGSKSSASFNPSISDDGASDDGVEARPPPRPPPFSPRSVGCVVNRLTRLISNAEVRLLSNVGEHTYPKYRGLGGAE